MTAAEPFTDTGAALLRAICLAPEDDAPRLIFADWLDENGEPKRAEFIRVQCEWLRGGAESDRREHLLSRIAHLWGSHLVADCDQWPSIDGFDFRVCLGIAAQPRQGDDTPTGFVNRGMIDQFSCTLADFMEHAQAIALVHPVQKWVLTDSKPWVRVSGDEFCIFASTATSNSPKDGHLPIGLYKLLRKGKQHGRVNWREYESQKEAIADREHACYHFSRQRLIAQPTTAATT